VHAAPRAACQSSIEGDWGGDTQAQITRKKRRRAGVAVLGFRDGGLASITNLHQKSVVRYRRIAIGLNRVSGFEVGNGHASVPSNRIPTPQSHPH
jgi:hypothetical protein